MCTLVGIIKSKNAILLHFAFNEWLAEQNRFRPVAENPAVDHPQGDGPPPGGRRNPVLAVPDPLGELTYQMAQMTTEMRNLRDTMTGLRTSVQENSDFTEQLADSNEQLISEMNDRDDR